MAKAGARPVVDIYSTFLQRSFDQIFQEVSLQNLPVVVPRSTVAGLVGSDGPTHHGSYDLAYMRMFPNMVVMAPGDEKDVAPMLDFALGHDGPTSIRYPKTNLETIEREAQPIVLGEAEILEWETDGMFLAMRHRRRHLPESGRHRLREHHGLRVGVINARFAKPLDRPTTLEGHRGMWIRPDRRGRLPARRLRLRRGRGRQSDAGLNTTHVRRLGLPDRFILHAERDEQLAEVGLDIDGLTEAALSTWPARWDCPA